jgi:hypothetical protein
MVLTIISVIVFFVLITTDGGKFQHAAIMIASVTELTLYTMTTIAVLFGMYQVDPTIQTPISNETETKILNWSSSMILS